jgi:GxxExxY protein
MDLLTENIIGAAIEVHRELGCGLLEKIYSEALCIEFLLRGISFEREVAVMVQFKGHSLGGQRIGLLVEKEIVVELKSMTHMPDIAVAQTLSYLKATGLKKALLINFGEHKLVNGVRRIVL